VNHLWYNFNKERKLQMATTPIMTNANSGSYKVVAPFTGVAELQVYGTFSGAGVLCYHQPDNVNDVPLRDRDGRTIDFIRPNSIPIFVNAGEVLRLEIFNPQENNPPNWTATNLSASLRQLPNATV
jgi:hypothetical protein